MALGFESRGTSGSDTIVGQHSGWWWRVAGLDMEQLHFGNEQMRVGMLSLIEIPMVAFSDIQPGGS